MSEHREQVAVMQWARLAERSYPNLRLLHAIPNGGARHIATATKLKAEGVKKGVPDLCLPVPCGEFHGLYIELKAKGGRMTAEQERWLDDLARLGYFAVMCIGADSAIKTIEGYLDQ